MEYFRNNTFKIGTLVSQIRKSNKILSCIEKFWCSFHRRVTRYGLTWGTISHFTFQMWLDRFPWIWEIFWTSRNSIKINCNYFCSSWILKAVHFHRVEIVETLDFTGKGPNGTLTGIGGQLLNHEIDLGTPLSVFLPFRLERLTFLHPLKSSRCVETCYLITKQ